MKLLLYHFTWYNTKLMYLLLFQIMPNIPPMSNVPHMTNVRHNLS